MSVDTDEGSRVGRTYQELLDERSLRVNTNKTVKRYVMYSKEKHNLTKIAQTAFKGLYDRTPLNQTFMSGANIQKVQNAIRYSVFKKINEKISEQDPVNLSIIMRDVYINYSKNLLHGIPEQVSELNNYVVELITPYLISNIKQHLQYLVDKNLPYRVMDRPINISSAGTKSLSLDTAYGF